MSGVQLSGFPLLLLYETLLTVLGLQSSRSQFVILQNIEAILINLVPVSSPLLNPVCSMISCHYVFDFLHPSCLHLHPRIPPLAPKPIVSALVFLESSPDVFSILYGVLHTLTEQGEPAFHSQNKVGSSPDSTIVPYSPHSSPFFSWPLPFPLIPACTL